MSRAAGGLRVLHLGPLDSIHLARWVELTAKLGHVPLVAGHLRPGFEQPAFAGNDSPYHSPQVPWASTRRAEQSGRLLHRLSAGLPNALLEVPLCAGWMRRLHGRIAPDVVHAHWLPHWGAAAALARCAPLVVSALGSDVYLLRGTKRRLADLALARADAVLAPSPHATAALRARARRPERCLHLETGIDLDAFRPATEAERASARGELGLDGEAVVLSFRAATSVYNLPVVAEAFRRLQKRVPRTQLVVAHGPMRLGREAREELGRLGDRVRILGAVTPEQMHLCYRAADVGVSIPSSDGSPTSVWEALACATPVVCSDIRQVAERVGEGEGVLVTPINAGAVARALEAALVDPGRARDLGRAGRAWVETNVDRRTSLERLDGVYRELARPS